MIDHNSRVLVTGGAGFIGSHLVERLVEIGAQVTVVDMLSTGAQESLQLVLPVIDFIVADLSDALQSERVKPDEYDYIFHLAANAYIPTSVDNPNYDFENNVVSTFMMLERMRATPSRALLINVSSAAVYGNPVTLPIRETDPTVPISPYGVSKLAAERYVSVYSEIYGVRGLSLRFFSCYGPRQRKQVVYDLIRKLRNNPCCLEVIGDGSQERDLTYVGDIVQAMLVAAAAAEGRGEVYNAASGRTLNIAELVEACCRACEASPQIVYSGRLRPGDAEKWMVDTTRMEQLGFRSATSLESGIATVRDWYDATASQQPIVNR